MATKKSSVKKNNSSKKGGAKARSQGGRGSVKKKAKATAKVVRVKKSVRQTDAIQDNLVIASLSYLWVLCIIPLILKPNNQFVHQHAKQGLVLFILELMLIFVFWVPIIGQLWLLGCLLAAVVGISQARQGKSWQAPILFRYAQKLNF